MLLHYLCLKGNASKINWCDGNWNNQWDVNQINFVQNEITESAVLLGSRYDRRRVIWSVFWICKNGICYLVTRKYVCHGNETDTCPIFFTNIEWICVCSIISKLMVYLGIPYDGDQWRLFINKISKTTLKAILLHNSESTFFHTYCILRDFKRNFVFLKLIIDLIKYKEYNWKVCEGLKVIAWTTGMAHKVLVFSPFVE